MTDSGLMALGRYTMHQTVQCCRYGKLLLGLRRLSQQQLGTTLQIIFKTIIDDLLLQKIDGV